MAQETETPEITQEVELNVIFCMSKIFTPDTKQNPLMHLVGFPIGFCSFNKDNDYMFKSDLFFNHVKEMTKDNYLIIDEDEYNRIKHMINDIDAKKICVLGNTGLILEDGHAEKVFLTIDLKDSIRFCKEDTPYDLKIYVMGNQELVKTASVIANNIYYTLYKKTVEPNSAHDVFVPSFLKSNKWFSATRLKEFRERVNFGDENPLLDISMYTLESKAKRTESGYTLGKTQHG